ncbi:hypothetical protein [Haloarchaeobius sp. TZWSO28]|uniref:hypothetical protein n=1 Tax=Haloarchaeobius sp. TZWSO28 TaxID=3446119 RepID=UPI003EBE0B56
MDTNTAHVGLWATKEMGEITVNLGSTSNWNEPAPVDELPKDQEYYLGAINSFVQERLDGASLFEDLSKYELTLVGEFTINGDGEILSHTLHI